MDILCLGPEDILTRVSQYQLARNDGRMFIDVHEVIGGNSETKFIAVPNAIIKDGDPKYFGMGSSEREALSRCLELIFEVPLDKVVPSSKSAP